MTLLVSAQAEQTFHQFGTLRTYQTCYAENFSLAHIEADIAEALGVDGSKILDLKNDLAGFVLSLRIEVGQLTTYHLGDDEIDVQVLCSPSSDVLTISHDGNFIRDTKDFIHLMADIYNRNTFAAQFVYNRKQCFYLCRGQRRGRLIQNQNLTVSGNSLCNFNQLHLRNAQCTQFCFWVKVQMYLFKHPCGILIHLVVVDDLERSKVFSRITPYINVFTDAALRNRL